MANSNLLPEVFFKKSKELSHKRAFYYCRSTDLKWVDMTWSAYGEEVGILAGWLQKQGVGRGDKVAILSGNRPEWLISDLAIMSIGAISIPIYATSSQQDVTYILGHSESNFLLVDQLERIEIIKDIDIKNIVVFDRAPKHLSQSFTAKVHYYSEIRRQKKLKLEKNVKLDRDDLCTIIYTSGTTGLPKGVMHTHGNFAAASEPLFHTLESHTGETDRYISFLPLSHVAERILVELGSIITGSEVAFARSIDTLGEDLVRCRPTILLCVPRLWEKIYEKIKSGLLVAPPVKKKLFKFAQSLGEKRIVDNCILAEKDSTWQAKLSDLLVGNKLKVRLGLDRCRMFITGSAPTRPEVMSFFGAFGVRIREVYGLTENLCLGVLNSPDESVIGSCGKVFAGNEMKIADDQEILFKAPWNFKGYYKNPQATEEAFVDGWLATGDLGTVDEENRLTIVGRKKELLKTSGGKYVAPIPIEDRLKSDPLIQDAMVIGDERKYCVALVSLNLEIIGETPIHERKTKLKRHLGEVNEPLASYETIKRVGVMKNSFSVSKGSLTPSLKIKRTVVHTQHKDFIEVLYKSDESVIFEI